MAALGVLNSVELVSMVVQWLKQITLEEESVEFGDHGRPKIPTTWTCHFARISTVNRVFFYASIDVLWERLSSVKPLFGCVLPADRDANGMLLRRLSYKKNELTYRHWDRFKLYSAKTKVLIVDDSICMHSAWMSHMMASEDRPRALFPSLRRLYLAATTPLAMCITYNCIPSVHVMEVEIELAQVKEKRDNFRAILTGLSQKSCVLTDLRIKRPATFSVIGAISRILSLTNLEITVGGTSAEVSGLGNLASLPWLQKLKIDHYHDLMVKVPASTLRGLDLDIDSQYSGSQQTRFTKLRELYVRAPGTMQHLLAPTLLPHNLEKLEIVLVPGLCNTQAALVPVVVAAYARGNPSLSHLTVTMDLYNTSNIPARHNEVRYLRSDPRYADMGPLLESIGSLRNLTHFVFRDIPCLAVDIVPRLLKTVMTLRLLETLVIKPNPMSGLDVDYLTLPSLEIIRDIALDKPRLKMLGLVVDLVEDPPVTADDDLETRHGLQSLTLYSFNTLEHTEEKKFSIAHYLETLLPQVGIDLSGWDEDAQEREFWDSVGQLLRFSRDSRARLLQKLEKEKKKA